MKFSGGISNYIYPLHRCSNIHPDDFAGNGVLYLIPYLSLQKGINHTFLRYLKYGQEKFDCSSDSIFKGMTPKSDILQNFAPKVVT